MNSDFKVGDWLVCTATHVAGRYTNHNADGDVVVDTFDGWSYAAEGSLWVRIPQTVHFVCDRRACERCNPECYHTNDILHAENFQTSPEGSRWEILRPQYQVGIDLAKGSDRTSGRYPWLGNSALYSND